MFATMLIYLNLRFKLSSCYYEFNMQIEREDDLLLILKIIIYMRPR